jgi:hypothetical protein
MLVVRGEAGVGKTALLQHVAKAGATPAADCPPRTLPVVEAVA